MALTKGQIESFSLISMNAIACQYAAYVDELIVGCKCDKEEYFFELNAMWNTIWLYNPAAANNCLTVDQITSIIFKMMQMLNFTFNVFGLPETNVNDIIPIPPPLDNFLLQDNGFFILQNDGFRIIINNDPIPPPPLEDYLLQDNNEFFILQDSGFNLIL